MSLHNFNEATMHTVIASLKNALAYAKFTDADVKDATEKLVDELGIDLEPDYEPGTTVEEAQRDLEEALNNTDSATEATDAAIKDADAEQGAEDDEQINGIMINADEIRQYGKQ